MLSSTAADAEQGDETTQQLPRKVWRLGGSQSVERDRAAAEQAAAAADAASAAASASAARAAQLEEASVLAAAERARMAAELDAAREEIVGLRAQVLPTPSPPHQLAPRNTIAVPSPWPLPCSHSACYALDVCRRAVEATRPLSAPP